MEKLFETFTTIEAQDWKKQIEKDLKGTPYEALQQVDANGILIDPFYVKGADHKSIIEHNDWEIGTLINAQEDCLKANSEALNLLNNGVSALFFQCNSSTNFDQLLAHISLENIFTAFHFEGSFVTILSRLNRYLNQNKIQLTTQQCQLHFDPIAALLSTGNWDKTQAPIDFLNLVKDKGQFTISNHLFHNAGASASHQVSYALAQLNEYLHLLEKNQSLDQLQCVYIGFSVGTLFFEEIAKLRAARACLQQILDQYQSKAVIKIHAESSQLYLSPYDVHSNLIRNSIAGMAAVIGGCNSLLLQNFDAALQADNEFSKRMAINQQLLFKEEAYLNICTDIAHGAYYIEQLSDQLAEKAWSHFQTIEQSNGIIEYFENGSLKKEILIDAQQLIESYKSGKKILVGVNKYPNPKDQFQVIETVENSNNTAINALELYKHLLMN